MITTMRSKGHKVAKPGSKVRKGKNENKEQWTFTSSHAYAKATNFPNRNLAYSRQYQDCLGWEESCL